MKKSILLLSCGFVISLFLTPIATAQNGEIVPCHTDEFTQEMLEQNPQLEAQQEQMEASILDWKSMSYKRSSSPCDTRIIPTVVHVIHNDGPANISDTKVQQLLEQNNAVWKMQNFDIEDLDELWHDVVANMNVELRLAKIDENGDPTTGIVRVKSSATQDARDNVKSISPGWDNERYLNIWLVRSIENSSGQGTVLGFAYFPWMENSTNSGIVCRYDVMDRFPTTMAHELGHYLNLYHPFQGSCGSSDCQTSGDRVCDTPPRLRSNQDCPLRLNSCSNDAPDLRDQVENIMDYTSCRSIFTLGQKERVDYTFDEYRSELISINNLYATGVIDSTDKFGELVAEFTSDITDVCVGNSISFQDLSCTNINNTDYTWLFPSGKPSVSFDRNPKVTYDKSGQYDVTLIIKNGNEQDTLTLKNYVRVIADESDIPAPIYEDFETSSAFPYAGWTTQDGFNDISWQLTDQASSSGTYSLMLENFNANNAGKTFVINLPPVDMTQANEPVLTFDVAYARRSNITDIEELKVFVKEDCDGFDLLRLSERAARFASKQDYDDEYFVPANSGEWKNYIVDLNAFRKNKSLQTQIQFVAAGGNNFYIDNISLGDWSLSAEEIANNNQNLSIYPNPARAQLHLQYSLSNAQNVGIRIVSATGQVLVNQQQESFAGSNEHIINTAMLPKGMYYVMVETEQETIKRKLLIQ